MNEVRDGRRHNFTIIDNPVIDDLRLGPYAGWAYVIMCRMAKDGTLFPSMQTLADKAGMSRRKMVSCIEQLESIGLVSKQARATEQGRQTSHIFTVHSVHSGVARGAGSGLHEVQGEVARGAHEQDINNNNTKEEQKIPPKAGAKRKPAGYINPDTGVGTNDIRDAYLSELEKMEPGCQVNFGQLGRTSKNMAKNGVTPDQVTETFLALKSEQWWQSKHVSLETVGKNLGAKSVSVSVKNAQWDTSSHEHPVHAEMAARQQDFFHVDTSEIDF